MGGFQRLVGAGGPDDRRAVSAVIAFVVMTGIVVVASLGIVVLGGSVLDDGTRNAEVQRVELSMVEMGQAIDSVAVSSADARTVDLTLPDDSDGVVRKEDTGRIVVTRYDGTEREVVNRTVGSIVYENGEAVYAYEAGAVWRGTGAGTSMVSAPELTYRGDTLTLPAPDVSGDRRIDSERVRVTKNWTRAPLNDVEMVRGELVTLEITSPYYAGWAQFFRQRIDGVGVEVDHATETTVVRLADPTFDGNFERGIVATGDVDASNPSTTVNSEVRTTGDFEGSVTCDAGSGDDCVEEVDDVSVSDIDVAIEVRTEMAREDPEVPERDLTGGETLTAGTYYLPDNTYLINDGDLTLDLGTGNVTLVSDGNLALKNSQIRVVNASGNHAVRLYMNHTDVAIGNGGGIDVAGDEADLFQVYGTSDTQFSMGQANSEGFTGVLYAPRESPDGSANDAVEDNNLANARCSADVCFGKGSGPVTGAVIAGDVEISQNTDFTYDADLQSATPMMAGAATFPPPITFLHVAVHDVEVSDQD